MFLGIGWFRTHIDLVLSSRGPLGWSLCHTICLMRASQCVFKWGGQALLFPLLYRNQLTEHFIPPHRVLDERIKRLNHVSL